MDGSSGGREPRAAERGLQTGSAGLAQGEPVRNGGPGPSWARRAGTRLLTKCPGGACGQPSVSTWGTAPEPWRRLSRRSLSDGPSQEGGAGSPRPPQAKSGTSQLALAGGNAEGPACRGRLWVQPARGGRGCSFGGAWSPGAVYESTAPRGRLGGPAPDRSPLGLKSSEGVAHQGVALRGPPRSKAANKDNAGFTQIPRHVPSIQRPRRLADRRRQPENSVTATDGAASLCNAALGLRAERLSQFRGSRACPKTW